jgi:hypothetical protein
VNAVDKINLGSFYTPEPVADLVLSLVLGGRDLAGVRLIDPTCGDGGFLALAVARGLAPSQLAGLDIDAEAVAAARARVPGVAVAVGDLFSAELGGGFTAVVGNPPYVRVERVGAATKGRVAATLARLYPDAPAEVAQVIGRGDLAAWSMARSAALLGPGGRLGFVVSAALLDADYAAPLWRLLGRRGRLRALVSSPRERWFADAAVHTVIALFERDAEPGPVDLCRLRVPIAAAAARVAGLGDLDRVAEIRRVDPRRLHAARLGAILRAPAAWLELEPALGDRLIPLGAVARVRRGFTTGANDVFYLSRRRAAELGIEAACLAPLVKAPPRRGPAAIAVAADRLDDLVLVAPPAAELDRFPATRAYLQANAEAARRPTLAARPEWWSLRRRRAQIFLAKAYARRFVQRWSPGSLDCDQRVYAVEPASGLAPELLAAVLNATPTALAIEALGRASMGEGALEWTVADARALPVLDPRRLDADAVTAAFAEIAPRPIGAAGDEIDRPDRDALDRAVAADLDHHTLRCALAEAVDERCERARS